MHVEIVTGIFFVYATTGFSLPSENFLGLVDPARKTIQVSRRTLKDSEGWE